MALHSRKLTWTLSMAPSKAVCLQKTVAFIGLQWGNSIHVLVIIGQCGVHPFSPQPSLAPKTSQSKLDLLWQPKKRCPNMKQILLWQEMKLES